MQMSTVIDEKEKERATSASTNDNEYITDVVADFKCQNQDDEYLDSYKSWRNKENNTYAYKFKKDNREHTYMNGVGFVQSDPSTAESIALKKCCILLGITMLIMITIELLGNLYIKVNYKFIYNNIMTQINNNIYKNISFEVAIVLCIKESLTLLVPFAFFNAFAKVPLKVMFPTKMTNKEMLKSALPIVLFLFVIGKTVNIFLSSVLGLVNIEMTFFDYIYSTDKRAILLFAFTQIILVSVFHELFFRGLLLQTFRQFGDLFALVLTSSMGAIAFADFTLFGYYLFVGFAIGFFVLKTGSILTGMLMRITSRSMIYLIISFMIYSPKNIFKILDTVLCFLCLASGLCVLLKYISLKKYRLNLKPSETALSTKSKIYIVATSPTVFAWLFVVFVATLFSIRFIN